MAMDDDANATTAADFGDRKLTGVPLIFMFQPCEFVVVKPEKVQDWETLMKENVGLTNFAEFRAERTHGFETVSLCHPGGACDCDWHDEDFPEVVTAESPDTV